MKSIKQLLRNKINRKKKNIKYDWLQSLLNSKSIIKIFVFIKKIIIFLVFIIFLPLIILFVILNGFIGIFFVEDSREDLLDE